ncbi:MAG: pyridoxal-phosphate dependent enzyme [Pseudomonas sp.]|uniref:1-aminocyclopropane-1-carboxylate deaminase/D-cysteine desulfhydrase n=1 Tax=Pseudomonas sp. TaxID=306 RepID=UPI0033942FEF
MRLPRPPAAVLLEPLRLDWLTQAEVEVAVLRLDRVDPLITGNKWFKLAPHLEAATRRGAEGVISLGGPHSNHLHALAAAGHGGAFPCVGLLRGEPQDTPTVRDLQAFGMQLHWLGYGGYRARHQADFWLPWQARYPGLAIVPEGGGGLLGAQGCGVLLDSLRVQLPAVGWPDYHAWWLAVGTGTTLAGLVLAEGGRHPVYGALALPAGHGAARQVQAVLGEAGAATDGAGYHLLDACRGGFAKLDTELAQFMLDTEAQTGLPLEPLYTAKALMALRDHVRAGYFAAGSRLVFVHTGGLQGRRASIARVMLLAGRAASYTESRPAEPG